MHRKHKAPHRKKIGLLLFTLVVGVTCLFGVSMVKANLIQIKRDTLSSIARVKETFIAYPTILKSSSLSKNTKTIPVLVYHGILSNEQETDRFSIPQDRFREQMVTLYQDGYRTITIEEFKEFMEGKKNLPAKSFLLTFDDGRKDSFYRTDPIFEKLGYTAVMFTASGQSADKNNLFSTYYLNIIELRKMIETKRWDIQSHAIQTNGGFVPIDKEGTKEYFLSNKQWLSSGNRLENDKEYKERIAKEFSESKSVLESVSSGSVFAFSYPFSDFGQQTKNNKTATSVITSLIKESYKFAFQQQWSYEDGFVGNHPSDDRYHLRRIEPASDWTGEYLVTFLNGGEDIAVSSKEVSFKNDTRRWKSAWGKREIKNNNLLLRTLDGKVSSFTLLDGSRAWENYMFSVDAILHDAGAFALYANLERPGTGIRCVWRGGSLSVEYMHEGKVVDRNLFSSTIVFGKHTFSIISKNGMVGCVEDGKTVGGINTPNSVLGGVGVEFWSNSSSAYAEIIDSRMVKAPDQDIIIPPNNSYNEGQTLVTDISFEKLIKTFKSFKEVSKRYDLLSGGTTEENRLQYSYWGKNYIYPSSVIASHTYDMKVTDYKSGGAMWKTEIIVPQVKEYEVHGKYTSSTSTSLSLEYLSNDNILKWITIDILPTAYESKEYSYTIVPPKGVKNFRVLQQLNGNGSFTIFDLSVKPLQDGSFDKGYVTLSFDDGYSSFSEKVAPLLAKYNMVAVVPVITGVVGYKNYMSIGDLITIQQAGHEIVAHTRHHVHLDQRASTTALVSEITGSRFDLEKAGFSTDNFVYPYGSFSDEAVQVLKKSGYKSARTVNRGFNTKNTEPFYLSDQIIEASTTLSEIDEYLKITKENKYWLILELHRVTDTFSPEDPESITVEELETLLKRIQDSGLEVITQKQGLEKMSE